MSNTIKKERILTSRNHKVIDQKIGAQLATAKRFNEIIQAYSKLEIDELNLHDLVQLITVTNTNEFVKDRMIKDRNLEMNVAGLKLSVSALASMIEIPDLTELEKAINNFRQAYKYTEYVLDGLKMEDNQVVISSPWVEALIEENSMYADSEKEKELFILMSEIVDRMNKMRTKYSIRHFLPGGQQGEVLFTHFCQDDKKFKVSANALKRFCKETPFYQE